MKPPFPINKAALALLMFASLAGLQTEVTHAETAPAANRTIIRISKVSRHPVVLFAAGELERCLRRQSGATVVQISADKFTAQARTVWVGCFADFPNLQAPGVADPARDDAIVIRVEDGRGIVAGANPRAVLIAAYQYLTELGCHWVRPGRNGEIIPALAEPLSRKVCVSEVPAYRHRGICIEGACSSEHVKDLVDWLPKVGMNSYFIEYLNGYIYYNNWYSERHKPEMRSRLLPDVQVTEFADQAIAEMQQRGLLVHRVGHGWTCLPLGIPPELWDEPVKRDFGAATRYLAQYQGKRELYRGIPRRTHLCYSQPEVRALVVQELVHYAAAHPEVDYLHFWLADGGNHCCECADCRQARPADFYVQMLNQADQLLTERGLRTRIAFLIYMDLLWPPALERIRNPDRFLLMFAPLNRSYYQPFDPAGLREPLPPFVLNQLAFPTSQNLNFLAARREVFPGDSFIYDYRFMWGQYDDPGYMELARATALDVPSLAGVGLNGLISDQTQRTFLPSGLPMTVLARSLWRGSISYDEVAGDYFAAAFGLDGWACREYLEQLSAAFNPRWLSAYVPRKGTKAPPSTVAELEKIPQIVSEFRPVIERNRSVSNECHAASWKGLAFHADLCLLMAEAIKAEVQGRPRVAGVNWRKIEELAVAREDEVQSTFDVFLFLTSMKQKHLFFRLP